MSPRMTWMKQNGFDRDGDHDHCAPPQNDDCAPGQDPTPPVTPPSDGADGGGLLGNLLKVDADGLLDLNIGDAQQSALIDVAADINGIGGLTGSSDESHGSSGGDCASACGDDSGSLLGNLISVDTNGTIDLDVGDTSQPALIDVAADIGGDLGGITGGGMGCDDGAMAGHSMLGLGGLLDGVL